MATPHTIPSKLNTDTNAVTPAYDGDHLYITAILIAGTVTIDDSSTTPTGPIALPSPIICKTFTADEVGQVAYFEQ